MDKLLERCPELSEVELSERISANSCRIRSAWRCSRAARGVGVSRRGPRRNSGSPSSFSSARIVLLTLWAET